MNDRLVEPILDGQAFSAAYNKMPELIAERYKYYGEHFKLLKAAESLRTLNTYSGSIDAAVHEHLDLFTDPRLIKLSFYFEIHAVLFRISVLLSPVQLLKTMPKCHIYAMEHDVLRDEEILFYNAAQKAGGNVDLTIWEGAMHIEQSFSSFWHSRTVMAQSDVWIGQYLDKIGELANE